MNSNNLQLGQRLKDAVSGFTGIATSRTDFMTGNVQFCLQPESVKGEEKAAKNFDASQLDFVDDGLIARATPAPEDTGVVLGQKVEDIVTKIVGIATRRVTFLNGCVYYSVVTAEVTGSKPIPSSEYFTEYQLLKKVGAGVTATLKTAAKKEATGGPAFHVPARG